MEVIVRKKERRDCKDVAKVVTLGWRQTYRGIVNDTFLDGLSLNEDERAMNSYNKFDENENNCYVLEVDGNVVGFVKYSESEDINFKHYGEIKALYIIDGYKGYGYGKLLFQKARDNLKKLGFNKMIISCLDGNKANEFYKHMNGKLSGTRVFKKTGQELIENIYTYDI